MRAIVVAAAQVPPARLIDWTMKFQIDGDVDHVQFDPVAYAPALGENGMAAYRARLDDLRARLGPEPRGDQRWSSPHAHDWFTLGWNAQRVAVLDHDIDAIIRTHARDRKVAAWLQDTAEAFEEIGEVDLPSTGPSRPPTSTAGTSHSRPPPTGANSSPSIAPTTCSTPGPQCSPVAVVEHRRQSPQGRRHCMAPSPSTGAMSWQH